MDASVIAQITGTNYSAPFDTNATMSSPSTTESSIPITKEQDVPASHLRRGSAFLVLTPVLSNSYPAIPAVSRSTSIASESAASAEEASPTVDTTTVAEIESVLKKTRRSSSVSSTGSGRARYLRLGPVHWGGEPGVPDFVEADE